VNKVEALVLTLSPVFLAFGIIVAYAQEKRKGIRKQRQRQFQSFGNDREA
jgi:hypothetical protein